jgi:hypothetical protein
MDITAFPIMLGFNVNILFNEIFKDTENWARQYVLNVINCFVVNCVKILNDEIYPIKFGAWRRGEKQSRRTNTTQIPTKRFLLFHLDERTLVEPMFL